MAKKQDSTERNILIRKKALLKALESTMGNVSQACKLAEIGRESYYRYMKDEAFANEVNGLQEITFDFVEAQIIKQINQGNTTMIIFFAKTKMRSRGYIERQELSVTDHAAFVVSKDQKGVMKILKTIKDENAKAG